MSTVLIVDPSKPSMVMSSEVFKDKIPGINVLVAGSGKQALEVLEQCTASAQLPDLCVVEFDLPDTDGVTLIHLMRKTFRGPILLTAYPDPVVVEAVNSELFAYDDAGMWIRKPVKTADLNEKIDRFLLGKFRVQRRFDFTPKTRLLGKSEGRGKRTPKFPGQMLNISIGGACLQLQASAKFKLGEELSLELPLPKAVQAPAAVAQIKSQVVWRSNDGKRIGIQFESMTDNNRKTLDRLLRQLSTGEQKRREAEAG
jgi:CheY-like chemotaxis protein